MGQKCDKFYKTFKYMFKHKQGMVSKTITVTEEAYHMLNSLKNKYESFSDVLLRLGTEKSVADKYFGILAKGNVMEARENLKKVRAEISEDFRRKEHAHFRHKCNN